MTDTFYLYSGSFRPFHMGHYTIANGMRTVAETVDAHFGLEVCTASFGKTACDLGLSTTSIVEFYQNANKIVQELSDHVPPQSILIPIRFISRKQQHTSTEVSKSHLISLQSFSQWVMIRMHVFFSVKR